MARLCVDGGRRRRSGSTSLRQEIERDRSWLASRPCMSSPRSRSLARSLPPRTRPLRPRCSTGSGSARTGGRTGPRARPAAGDPRDNQADGAFPAEICLLRNAGFKTIRMYGENASTWLAVLDAVDDYNRGKLNCNPAGGPASRLHDDGLVHVRRLPGRPSADPTRARSRGTGASPRSTRSSATRSARAAARRSPASERSRTASTRSCSSSIRSSPTPARSSRRTSPWCSWATRSCSAAACAATAAPRAPTTATAAAAPATSATTARTSSRAPRRPAHVLELRHLRRGRDLHRRDQRRPARVRLRPGPASPDPARRVAAADLDLAADGPAGLAELRRRPEDGAAHVVARSCSARRCRTRSSSVNTYPDQWGKVTINQLPTTCTGGSFPSCVGPANAVLGQALLERLRGRSALPRPGHGQDRPHDRQLLHAAPDLLPELRPRDRGDRAGTRAGTCVAYNDCTSTYSAGRRRERTTRISTRTSSSTRSRCSPSSRSTRRPSSATSRRARRWPRRTTASSPTSASSRADSGAAAPRGARLARPEPGRVQRAARRRRPRRQVVSPPDAGVGDRRRQHGHLRARHVDRVPRRFPPGDPSHDGPRQRPVPAGARRRDQPVRVRLLRQRPERGLQSRRSRQRRRDAASASAPATASASTHRCRACSRRPSAAPGATCIAACRSNQSCDGARRRSRRTARAATGRTSAGASSRWPRPRCRPATTTRRWKRRGSPSNYSKGTFHVQEGAHAAARGRARTRTASR